MLRNNHFCWLLPYHLLLILILIGIEAAEVDRKEDFYIVFLKDHPVVNDESAFRRHINVLSSLKGRDATESHVYSYTKIFNAFAAKLSQQEVRKLSSMDEVASVIPSRYRRLHTTRSWEFIGLPATAKRRLKGESNIIVGVFDTGITPQSKSFKDDGLGPPPAKWKGSCHHFANFTGCNNKLIGARYFKLDKVPDPNDIMSPIDVHGHGTHTSSTLAGSLVPGASLFGLARGTARGAVPSARVAMYKVCWASSGCSDIDILAAFEASISDGVDIISISVGGLTGSYTTDVISVGAFHAMRKGILTVASAGNDGPNLNTVANHAPWVLTVAASGIDRQFRSNVKLGSGRIVSGIGISAFDPKQKLYPLALGVDIAKSADTRESSRYCTEGSMDSKKVKGKLVYCQLGSWGADSAIKEIGGVGTIIESDQFLDSASIFMAPATIVNSSIGKSINNYIHSERLPSAVIYKSREVKIKAPFIASFSSRGPNPGTKRLLKPDIAAPGIDILASYTPLKSLTGLKGDTQYSEFTLMSGTSMSCPHVGGAAAYVKSFHSDWSPSAIKSALMTTARPMSSKVDREREFAYGAGQVNPTRARSPGLIYDMDDMSYIQFLCHEGYNSSSVSSLLRQRVNCSTLIPANGEDAINYPTMQLGIKSDQEPTVGVFRRRITNVGQATSVYNATIRAPKGVDITVKPMTLSFTRVMQKRSFKVVVKAKPMSNAIVLSGSLSWKSSRHIVRSPIVIYDPKVFG
ncbi:subtilisin-like protease SBT4.14 [Lycium barbarum]|uniref:subtilisin-like protease SBT4.14 n=1 Tax=Lycium barbarum TaxID=112863 RepID=UPI00293F1C5F|nr:subtilisin-like protease SBT4.14 [Lycium barbarum]